MTLKIPNGIILILSGIILGIIWILAFAEPDLPYIEWMLFIGTVTYVLYGVLKFS